MAKRWRTAALNFVAELEQEHRYAQAANLLTRLHETEPLNESLFRRALRNFFLAGQKDEALEVFARFVRRFKQEFGGEPEAETLRLADAIRRGEAEGVEAAVAEIRSLATPNVPTPPSHNLALQPTPFVGRQAQKEELS